MIFKTNSVRLLKISKVISNIFNPLTSLFLFFVYESSRKYTVTETIVNFIPILLITIIPITIWISWNVKKGRYTNLDVSNRNQRKSLYFFIAGMLLIYLMYNYVIHQKIDFTMTFLLLLLLVLQISNYFIKSSMHTAFNVFVAALFFNLNPYLGYIWLGIAVAVGITRIILKRHTLQEVLTGAFIALLVSFIYLYTTIHMQTYL